MIAQRQGGDDWGGWLVHPHEFRPTSLQYEWGWLHGGWQDLSASGWRTTKQPPAEQKTVFWRGVSLAMIKIHLLQACLWILNHFGNPTDFSEGSWVWNTWLTLITLFRNSRPFLFRGDSTVPGTWRVFHKRLLERWSDSCYSENPECDASSFCHCSWD